MILYTIPILEKAKLLWQVIDRSTVTVGDKVWSEQGNSLVWWNFYLTSLWCVSVNQYMFYKSELYTKTEAINNFIVWELKYLKSNKTLFIFSIDMDEVDR